MIVWILGIASVIALVPVPIFRTTAWVDTHTGSRRGYCEWAWGWRSGGWYKVSAVETFMRQNHPSEFRQRWVSHQGNSHNIFGMLLESSHGMPGPVLSLDPSVISEYSRTAREEEKRRIYDMLAEGDQAKIQNLVEHVFQGLVSGAAAPFAAEN